MYKDITAVALRTVRHNDRSSILTAWSPSLGRLSLVMPDGKGKESRRRRALTMPLSLFEGVADVREGADILRISDLRPHLPAGVPVDVASHPVRAAVAMFVAEVLGVVTREGEGDPALWRLIVDTVTTLSTAGATKLANLPPAFLLRLGAVLGIEPDLSEYVDGNGLDMVDGVLRTSPPMHDKWVSPDRMRFLVAFSNASHGYAHTGLVRMSRAVRAEMLGRLIDYFVIHHYRLDRLRSLDILRTVFS